MNKAEMTEKLIGMLLEDMPFMKKDAKNYSASMGDARRLLRGLMNIRPPMPLSPEFLSLQDELLQAELKEKNVTDGMALPAVRSDPRLCVWQGDITALRVDAIVDADNSALLGCFAPCHKCIDNAIHSAAGLQLRDECHHIMQEQGHDEPNGCAKITRAYNLPSAYVLHTVGPIVGEKVTARDREELASCYTACMALAAQKGLESVAFCCISTGEFHFPNREAAQIAVESVKKALTEKTSVKRVIFNVFKDIDAKIYRQLLDD